MNTAETFFNSFFDDRNLDGPNVQPLYRYRVRTSEFQELGDLLRRQLAERVFGHRRIEPSVAMAFCLWAAEWWHRNYEEGPWSWRPLLAELGRVDFAPGEPRYFELQSVVARGLEAWNRRVLRVGSTRAFLSTLACEGGLPMKVILRGHTPLRSYFRGVLEDYRLFGSAGIPPSELAERVRDRLPKAWRQDVVYQLSGELIAEVWRLQRELGDTETPVRDLDRRRPNWRDGLPLRVTDDVARTLLNGLLLDAAEVARGGRIRVRWTVELVPVDENLWELKGCFDLPATIGEESARRLFGGDHDAELPHRFDLGVQTRRRPFVPLALATALHTPDRGRFFGLERLPAAGSVQTAGVTHPRTLVARTPEAALQSDGFPGATGLSDLPWVFAPIDLSIAADDDGQTYRLVGQGSLKRREPWALVAVSDETVAEPGENGEAKPVGSIRNENGRCVYHVRGTVTFTSADGSRTVIATGAAADTDSVEYRLLGREKLIGRGAISAFLGKVTLRETRDGEFLRTVQESDLWWKPDGPGGTWRRYSSEVAEAGLIVGSGLLRYIKDDEVRHSVRACILPANADIKYLPSTDPAGGEIVLIGFGQIVATIPSTEGLTVTGRCQGDAYHLELEARDAAPTNVTVWIDWARQGRLALELPFPMKRAAFVGPDGETLPNEAQVAAGSLAGVTAEVVVPEAIDFELQGTYLGRDAAALRLQRGMIVRPLPSRTTGHCILDLTLVQGEVSERLELSDDPDGAVKLQIFSNHARGSLPPTSVIVRRFDLQFERRDSQAPLVGLDEPSRQQVSLETLDSLDVQALPLLDPDAEPTLLQRCSDAWSIPYDRMEPGPYLILGREGDWQRVRPMLWRVADTDEPDEDMVTEPRRVADAHGGHNGGAVGLRRFESVAHEMAGNYEHPDWPLVFGYLQHRSLPVATFPLLRAISRIPTASAMAAVRATGGEFEILWERMKTLPFAWWQIPLPCWRAVFVSFADSVRRELGTALGLEAISQFLGEVVDRRIALIGDRLPGLNAALGFIAARVSERPIPNEASRIAQPEMLKFLRQQFLVHRDSCPAHTMKERDIPQLSGLKTLIHRLKAQYPWSKSLFVDRTRGLAAKTRADFLDAPVVAGMLVVIGAAALDDLGRAIRDARSLHRRWFDEALQLAQLIAFGHQVSDQIYRHL